MTSANLEWQFAKVPQKLWGKKNNVQSVILTNWQLHTETRILSQETIIAIQGVFSVTHYWINLLWISLQKNKGSRRQKWQKRKRRRKMRESKKWKKKSNWKSNRNRMKRKVKLRQRKRMMRTRRRRRNKRRRRKIRRSTSLMWLTWWQMRREWMNSWRNFNEYFLILNNKW